MMPIVAEEQAHAASGSSAFETALSTALAGPARAPAPVAADEALDASTPVTADSEVAPAPSTAPQPNAAAAQDEDVEALAFPKRKTRWPLFAGLAAAAAAVLWPVSTSQELPCKLAERRLAELTAPASGTLTYSLADGAEVTAGAVVAQVTPASEPKERVQELERQLAELERQRPNLKPAPASKLKRARAQLKVARSQLEGLARQRAKLEASTTAGAARKRAALDQQLKARQLTLERAAKQYEALSHEQARAALDEQVKSAKASLAAAHAPRPAVDVQAPAAGRLHRGDAATIAAGAPLGAIFERTLKVEGAAVRGDGPFEVRVDEQTFTTGAAREVEAPAALAGKACTFVAPGPLRPWLFTL